MRQEAWHEEEYKGYSIKLFQDEDSESPRDWDNLGHMICFHPNYDLGDKHNMTPEELLELVKRKDVLADAYAEATEIEAVANEMLAIEDHSNDAPLQQPVAKGANDDIPF